MVCKENEKRPTTVVFVGSFDPFHEGHLSVVDRALTIFDRVVIGVGVNPAKNYMYSAERRVEQVRDHLLFYPNIEVETYSDLTIDFARRHGAVAIIKGVRNAADFAYEQQQAEWNLRHGGIETLLLPALPELKELSSTAIKAQTSEMAD